MLARLIFRSFFHGIRSVERLVPPPLLSCLLWPFVAVFAFRRCYGAAGRRAQRGFAEACGRPLSLAELWRSFIDETYLRLATLWPERFVTQAWRRRFVVTGLERVLDCQAARRPVVLAVIHAHHWNLIQMFLRAHGVPVASLTHAPQSSENRRLIHRSVDRRSPLAGVPHSFHRAKLRSAYAFLRDGKCLLVACDVSTKDAVTLPWALGTMRINVGPYRLAALAEAGVIPAVCWQEKPWRFHLSFGEPASAPARSSDIVAFEPLAKHCLAIWRPLLERHPEQVRFSPGVWAAAKQPTNAN
jgi:lauroyl/myristoyl acyltransferase